MKVKHPWLAAFLVLLLVLIAAAAVYADRMRPTMELGVAYAAHVTCSCRYIGGRDMASCEQDKLSGMEQITLSDDPAAKRVTASVPLLASRHAEFREGLGCVLEPWPEG